jgi:tRNA(fMet)-specific endonuclease VapC
MKYVLDTNAVSALMKGDAHVVARLEQTPRAAVVVPQPVLAEIAYGIERLPSSKKKEALRERYELLRSELARAAWTDAVTDAFGGIKASLEKRGERIEDFDAAIAAHAIGHDVLLVSADRDDMARVPGVTVEDWSRPARNDQLR